MSPETKDKQKITPYLWFDDQAEEAANSYVAIFSSLTGSASDEKRSQVGEISRYTGASAEVSGKPEGTAMTVEFQLAGQKSIALNGGPDIISRRPSRSSSAATQARKLTRFGSIYPTAEKF